MNLKSVQRVPVLIAVGVISLVCLGRLLSLGFFERFEWVTYDWRARLALRFPTPAVTNLGFVYIDQASIDAVRDGSVGFKGFGLYWPRQVYGRIVQELAQQGAKAVAFDVLFSEPRPDHSPVELADGSLVESDEFLGLQMRAASNVIMALTEQVRLPAVFLTNATAFGDISTAKDADGILRRGRAFQSYRRWHPLFLRVEADRGYGVNLERARVGTNAIVLLRENGEEIVIPLAADGTFALSDFVGDVPAGTAARARPFTEQRMWHLGLVLAARELELDLDHAEIDLERGRIVLRGPKGCVRVVPVDAEGYFYIDWGMLPNDPSLTQQPVHALLARNWSRLQSATNQAPPDWNGKLVIIGSAAEGNDLTDHGATPLSPHTLLVSKHWNVANCLLAGRFVTRSALGLDLAIIALLGAVVAMITWMLRPIRASLGVLVLMTAYVGGAVAVYVQFRYWLPLAFPLVGAMAMTHVFLVIWQVVFEQADKRRVKSIFSTVVSPKIVTELLDSPNLSLGGARREITVMFSDVRGFTEFADRSQEHATELVRRNELGGQAAEACFDDQARETLSTVNLYLGLVADIVINQDGTLDKFIGDCVMAFWGAPTPNPRHASLCVRAAVEAQRAIAALNQRRLEENLKREAENRQRAQAGLPPLPMLATLQLGTGINTGMATAGLMGSKAQQRNYTVFGGEVNLASRLESQSGKSRIFISETTYQHLLRDDPEIAATCMELPPVSLKGIRNAVKVFEVPWQNSAAPQPRAA